MSNTPEPRPVVRSYLGVMDRSPCPAEYADLWDWMLTLRGQPVEARRVAEAMDLDPGAASFHGRKLREGETYPSGADMLAEVTERRAARAKHRRENPPEPPKRSKYHPGAPTLPGNRSPSA